MSLHVLDCILGLFLGFILGVIFVTAITQDTRNILELCEQSLPRDEQCVIIAVPELTKEY